jgi:hypothetical protein
MKVESTCLFNSCSFRIIQTVLKLTSQSRICLEKVTATQLVQQLRVFFGPDCSMIVYIRTHHCSLKATSTEQNSSLCSYYRHAVLFILRC